MGKCYIIAGPNGAGKTTFARTFLPHYVGCVNFVNPDLIARGLSPFEPRRAILRAGRLVLAEIRDKVARGEDFAFETTLAGRTYLRTLRTLGALGYARHMFYLWIPSPELALCRIRERVACGGHDVPENEVRRRFGRSIANLLGAYRPLLDSLHVIDNSTDEPRLVCRDEDGDTMVYDHALYAALMERGET